MFYKLIFFVVTVIPDVSYDVRIVLLLKLPIGMLHEKILLAIFISKYSYTL
jgi:hypothetical protein